MTRKRIMNHTTCWIEPSLLEPARQHGLEGFDAWMNSAPGTVVSHGPGREVIRLHISGESFFLKRRRGESTVAMAGLLVHGHRPMCGALREARLLEQLEAGGFPVMKAAAYGERRVWGMPQEGFLLVRAVPGQLVADLYQKAEPAARFALMARVGQLAGKLHAAGFFEHLRLKDLIAGPDGTLTLIDRESRHPWAKRFTRRHALRAIARTVRRTLRDGLRFGPATARAFLNGYREGVAQHWRVTRPELRKQVFNQLRRELGR
jgi:tRNA A-37 threonylcarbamoyl transferase component Bud32